MSAPLILAVVEGKTFLEATAELPDIAAIKASAGLKPIDLVSLKKG